MSSILTLAWEAGEETGPDDAMRLRRKRKMADAGLSFHATNFRVDVLMAPDWINRWQGYESHMVLSSVDVIDRIKHKVSEELWMLHSRWLRPNTFHLVQRGHHLPYYYPVTSCATGHSVTILRNS